MTKPTRYGCLTAVLLLLLFLSLTVNLALFGGKGARAAAGFARPLPKFEEAVVQEGKTGVRTKIALIYLRGIILGSEGGSLTESMVEDLKLQLHQALADDDVKGIVLSIDSPGGEVTASDTIYNAVKQAREKKPVVIYMGSLAASGGYYVSCGGSYLIANDTTFTGSIGVIMQSLHYEGLFGKVGLSMTTFKSGKFKDMLSGSRAITDEEAAYVQSLIDETYGKFLGIVAEERKLDAQKLKETIADGRVISGKAALGAKLIDALGSVEDAYGKAMELGNAGGSVVVRYEAPFKLGRLFKLLGQSEHRSKIEVSISDAVKPKLQPGRAYFLPGFYAE